MPVLALAMPCCSRNTASNASRPEPCAWSSVPSMSNRYRTPKLLLRLVRKSGRRDRTVLLGPALGSLEEPVERVAQRPGFLLERLHPLRAQEAVAKRRAHALAGGIALVLGHRVLVDPEARLVIALVVE